MLKQIETIRGALDKIEAAIAARQAGGQNPEDDTDER